MRNTVEVGAGKAVIQLPESMFPIESFMDCQTPLYARVLYIKEQQTHIVVSLELTSLRAYEIQKLKEIVLNCMHVDEQHIWICVTHTFTAPHTRSLEALAKASDEVRDKNKQLCIAIEHAVHEACIQASDNIQTCYVQFTKGYADINVNRDVETIDGWWLGSNEKEYADKEVPVVSFVNQQHELVAIWFSYDMQSSIMDGYDRVCSDVTGRACAYIEQQYTDAVALYCVGAAGDQAPKFQMRQAELNREGTLDIIDHQEHALVFVEGLGVRLGASVVKALRQMRTSKHVAMKHDQVTILCDGQQPPTSRNDLHPTHEEGYVAHGTHATQIDLLYIGPIAIVALQPEIGSYTAHKIKSVSPCKLTMILTMVNGGDKYMANQMSYERKTYEAMNSKFAKGSEERLVKTCIHMLRKHRRKK